MRVPCCVMHRFSPSFCFRMFRKVEKLRLECSERCIIATEHFHAGSGFLAPSSTVYFPVASQTVPICHCTATKKNLGQQFSPCHNSICATTVDDGYVRCSNPASKRRESFVTPGKISWRFWGNECMSVFWNTPIPGTFKCGYKSYKGAEYQLLDKVRLFTTSCALPTATRPWCPLVGTLDL